MKRLQDIHEQWKLSAMAVSLGGFLGVFASSAMAQDPVVGVDPDPIGGISPGQTLDLPLVYLSNGATGVLGFGFDVQFPAGVDPVLSGGQVNGDDQCNQNAPDLGGSCFWNSTQRTLVVSYAGFGVSTLDPFGTVEIRVDPTVVAPTTLTLTTPDEDVECAAVVTPPPNCTGSDGTILVGAAPALVLAPDSATLLNLNDMETFTVSNTGGFALDIDSIELSGAGFSVGGTCDAGVTSLGSGANCTVTVTFTGGGFVTSTLTISTETAGADPAMVSAPISGGVQQPLVFEDQFETQP